MMTLNTLPLEFREQNGIVMPKDQALFDKVVKFMERHMGCRLPLMQMHKVWVAVEVDERGEYGRVIGIVPMRFVADLPGMRFLSREAADALIGRVRGYLQDTGNTGADVFVYIKDGADPHRCDGYKSVLESQKAEPAERWIVKV